MRRSLKEGAVVALALAAVAAAVYGPNAVHGGFHSAAWVFRSMYAFAPHPGFSGETSNFLNLGPLAPRPLYAIYLVALNGIFGSHAGFWLAWLVATNVLMALCLFLLLRKLEFALLDAGLLAGLVLIFPAASAIRLWAATVQIPAAVTFATLGFLLALIAFEIRGRRGLALHVASLASFVASLLFYEAALPAMLCSGLLYRVRVPWPRAIRRWAIDAFALILSVVLIDSSGAAYGAKESQGLAGMWQHGRVIFHEIWAMLATVVLPLGNARWYVLALIALIPLTAGFVARYLPPADPERARLLRWLAVLGAGAVVVILGYAIFVPGNDIYTPLGPGDWNRVNAVPSIGWVLILYALVMLAGTLAFRSVMGSRALRSGFAVVATALIAIWWLNSVSGISDAYTSSSREDERILGTMKGALPHPPPDTTIWTFGQPIEVVPGIPVFGVTWDMTAGVQLTYGDPTLRSYVAGPETTFRCLADTVAPVGVSSAVVPGPPQETVSPYGKTVFFDTSSGRFKVIRTRAECVRAARTFDRSPPLLGEPPVPPPAPAHRVEAGV